MKAQLETITSQVNRSFSMMFNPRLSDLFFWHSHPEYELVYIEGPNGTRHVGDHISPYTGSDLVLIGSNIPHLNFDYGVHEEYKEVVVHLRKEFVEQHFPHALELSAITRLFEESKRGIAFSGKIVPLIGEKLFNLEHLSPFQQYIQLVEILQLLSEAEQVETLHQKPYLNKSSNKEQQRMRLTHAFIDKNFHRKIELEEVAKICFMSKEGFCRYFKKMTTYTFIEFLNRYRVSHSKRYLMAGKSVGDACYLSGFQSLSYYNRVFKRVTNENPSNFRKRYL
ncbi:MAG: helix-turn-helix transcriptional regulator [Saprospiraceae bacterium]